MTQTEEDLKMLYRHDQLIQEDILPRLKRVEDAQVDFTKQVESIKASQTSLELTVMKDGQETRGLLNRFVDHYLETDSVKHASNERVTLKRLSSKEKVVIAVLGTIAGSGGLIAAIATLVQAMR